MRWSILSALVLHLVFSAWAWPAEGDLRHAGKAGIYVRLSAKQTYAPIKGETAYVAGNPLVDAVVLGLPWARLEPSPGHFDLDPVAAIISRWNAAGKAVVLAPFYYGQAEDGDITPAWIYHQPGVKPVTFVGGGAAKGDQVRIPAVWRPGFAETYADRLAQALAKRFDGAPGVWYVRHPLGHIGNLTAQPSKDGARAMAAAGWDPSVWEAYCRRSTAIWARRFRKTPLLAIAESILIRDRRRDSYRPRSDAILDALAAQGVAVIRLDLQGDAAHVGRVLGELGPVAEAARRGQTRIGLGDDWPLWVPPERRDQGPTRGRDDAYLQRLLDMGLGGAQGLPKLPITTLYCQLPEIVASSPRAPGYDRAVADALGRARGRLKANDALAFGAR